MLLLMLACASPEPASVQAEALAAVYAGAWEDADEALALCARITADQVRGECQLYAVRADGARCDRVDAGPWRDECWFEVAEAAREAGDHRATEYCTRSGRFLEDCCFHLWQEPMRTAALRARREEPTLVEARGREVLAGLSADITSPCLPPARFWAEWFQAVHDLDSPVDLAACEAHPAELRDWCRQGLEGVVMGRLDLLPAGSPDHEALCLAVAEDADLGSLPRVACLGCGPELRERLAQRCERIRLRPSASR